MFKLNVCATIYDQPSVHKVSQQVPGIKMTKLHLSSSSKHIDIFRRISCKKCIIVPTKVKK